MYYVTYDRTGKRNTMWNVLNTQDKKMTFVFVHTQLFVELQTIWRADTVSIPIEIKMMSVFDDVTSNPLNWVGAFSSFSALLNGLRYDN